jgi:prolipoprotein diacylglyceryltransferase
VLILSVAMPASQIVARLVEKKKHTLTVAGAFFVAVIFTPIFLWGVNVGLGDIIGMQIPIMPVMSTLAIAYAFGEGIGRLACISFGCCYGKPVHMAHPLLAKLFARWNFVFLGNTKKIAYASGLEGTQVIPIQALTAILYVGTGLMAALLFLKSYYLAAFILTMVVTQVWRFLSEALRADYRGQGRLSAYQIMALAATLYAIIIGLWLARVPAQPASLAHGLETLWHPAMLLFLQLLWIVSFVFTGKSSVTESRLAIHVCQDKI